MTFRPEIQNLIDAYLTNHPDKMDLFAHQLAQTRKKAEPREMVARLKQDIEQVESGPCDFDKFLEEQKGI